MNVDAIDFKRALVGTLGIVLAVVFIGILGPAGLLAGLCAIFLGALDEPEPVRERLALRTRFVVIGALVVGLLSWSGENVWWATLVAAVVTYIGTLAAGWGPRAAAEGQFIVFLAIVTLMVGSTDLSAIELAVAFVAGGIIATAVSLVGSRWAGDDVDEPEEAGAEDHLPDQPRATGLDSHSIAEVAQSEIGVFALVRALAVAIATASGYELFQDHPVWAVLTVVLVLQMPARQTWTTGLQRTAGTILGVLVGALVVQCLDSSTTAIVVAFVLAGFGLMAFKDVDYTVSTVFTTCVLLFSQRILQEDAFSAGWQRIGATLLGTGIALAFVLVTVERDRRSTVATEG